MDQPASYCSKAHEIVVSDRVIGTAPAVASSMATDSDLGVLDGQEMSAIAAKNSALLVAQHLAHRTAAAVS